MLQSETPHLSDLPLRGAAWYPFNPLRFCQPIARSDDERRALIATAAYLRAERRNFEAGRELEDWLAAEAELNRHFGRLFRSPWNWSQVVSVPKAIRLLDSDGTALAPATLCAEAKEEAARLNLPMFDHVIAELSAGKEIRVNGGSSYELFDDGQHVGRLEIFEAPSKPKEMVAPPRGRWPPELP
jgi:hypothetical protein